jgi:hypothetical protein
MKKFWLVLSILCIDACLIAVVIIGNIFVKDFPNNPVDELVTAFVTGSIGVIYRILGNDDKEQKI